MERRINEREAAVVRQIFERCAAGQGFRTIAHELNDAHVPAPRPQQQRPSGWAPSSVREVLFRDLYRGVIVWNKTRKRNLWGQQKPTSRLASEWIEIPAPDLQLVSDALWQAVHERLDAAHRIYLRANDGRLWGRPLHGQEAKHLLTGLARCGGCGGTMVVRSRNHGKRRAFYYACSSFHHRGRAVCANSLEMRLPDADDAILTALEGDLLAEDVIEEAMARAIALAIDGDVDSDAQKRRLEAGFQQVQGDLQRLTAAILAGGEAATRVQAIKDRERQREAIARDLLALERPRRVSADAARLRGELRAKLADWRAMLRAHVPQARQMIRKLVSDRIVFTADAKERLY